jgi:hypothetical protein
VGVLVADQVRRVGKAIQIKLLQNHRSYPRKGFHAAGAHRRAQWCDTAASRSIETR